MPVATGSLRGCKLAKTSSCALRSSQRFFSSPFILPCTAPASAMYSWDLGLRYWAAFQAICRSNGFRSLSGLWRMAWMSSGYFSE